MAHANALIRALLGACVALAAGAGLASGSSGFEDDFVTRTRPDADLGAYDGGALGIVLPTYPRIFLYPAWRAMLHRPAAAAVAPAPPGSVSPLGDICCERSMPMWDPKDPNVQTGPGRWLAVRRMVNPTAPRVQPELLLEGKQYDILNCPYAAWTAAGNNLQQLLASADATPGRLQAWVAAQDAVFEFCSWREGGVRRYGKDPLPKAELPLPLPGGEPLLWRQWRDYQIAAAHFYAGHHADAEARFLAIGAQSGHPMQRWGAYLALRARIRAASLDQRWEEQGARVDASKDSEAQKAEARKLLDQARVEWLAARHAEIVQLGQQLLARPDQQAVHDDIRVLLRVAAAMLVPRQRLLELSVQLDQVDADPYATDTLGDWVRLADNRLGYRDEDLVKPLRERHEWFDWMRTLQGCAGALDEPEGDVVRCVDEHAHALQRWTASVKAGRAQAAPWLVAALSTADQPVPTLLQAAAQVGEREPHYLTVSYHALRLLRKAGQAAAARKLGDHLLQRRFQSVSALNLIRAERFAVADSLEDAARHLLRQVAGLVDPDTGYFKPSVPATPAMTRIDKDGLLWLNERLTAAEMLQLADDRALPPDVARAIAQAAWWRADLLAQPVVATAAARWVLAHTPRLAATAQAYLDAPDAASQRHVLVLASLTEAVSPMVFDIGTAYSNPAPAKREEATANAWCAIGAAPAGRRVTGVPREGRGPAVQPASATAVAAELVRLGKLGTATSFVGAHVLRRLAHQPADPDLPWLLYVTVQSTKGGCVGPDNGRLSFRAWTELHKRYKNDPWTAKTPYWYK